MAHSKQALKRARQNDELRVKNKAMASAMKTAMKRVEEAVNAKDKALAQKNLTVASQRIDKCAKRRVVHPNNAARKKSQLAKLVSTIA